MGLLNKIFGGSTTRPEELDDSTIDAAIADSVEKPLLLQFYSDTCPPCRVMSGIVRELQKQLPEEIRVTKANVAYASQHAGAFAIQSVPTVLIFRNGRMVNRVTGLLPLDQLTAQVKAYV
ncbi:MAG: thioredoxin family protein [Candidatus Delongbacteria bacterium]|nr:thioredoxin family protein [bacterium]MBL7032685.1 thioredoxin family protein [Candidatus Delongbacteria bacterium]